MTNPMQAPELAPVLASLGAGGHCVTEVESMTGDVSQRRYFRLRLEGDPPTAVLALYPPAMRTAARRYLRATRLLAASGLDVPAILAVGVDDRWIVVEDLGPISVFELRHQPFSALEPLFASAVTAIGAIERLDRAMVAGLNPPLDAALLRRELAMTRRVFFEPRGLTPPPEIQAAFDTLCERLGEEHQVPCHRDFGVRNLVPRGAEAVAIVDHQDLRLGPAGYDLASLLNDSLFPSAEAEERLLQAAGAVDRVPYHRAAAQRTLKAVGSYAAFADRSPRYLPLIAPTLERALGHLAKTPETARWAPRLADQWSGVFAKSARP